MSAAPQISILDAMDDPQLLGAGFVGDSWSTWRAILRATFALPMTERDLDLFRAVAGRDPPSRPVRELVVIAGRRAGKDSIASAIAASAAAFRNYHEVLRPGERATVACLACDRDQSRIVLRYVKEYFTSGPLAQLVERETANGLDLSTGAVIEVGTNSYRAIRGRTIVLAIFDELAFWRDESSARPDTETYRAILPALATISGALLVMISTGYRKAGLLYEKYRKHYGKPGDDVLVIKAPSRTLNPTLDKSIIDAAIEDDPSAAAAEWLGEFRNDIETFVSREVVDAAVVPDRHELPPVAGVTYIAFADPSGGSADSMTLAIAHQDRATKCAILDAVRERRPPFSPEAVTREFAAVLKSYRVTKVVGDRYAGEWPRERFREHGIAYEPSERNKNEIYGAVLPLLNSGRVELLDLPCLTTQFCGLERRTARGGRDSIDHASGAHDDLANAVAGALVLTDTASRLVTSIKPLRL